MTLDMIYWTGFLYTLGIAIPAYVQYLREDDPDTLSEWLISLTTVLVCLLVWPFGLGFFTYYAVQK